MPPKVSARELHAEQLAKEIIAVYKSVRDLEPNILESIEAGRKQLNKNGTLWPKNLSWFSVKKDDSLKENNDVRGLMLKKYRMDPDQRDAVATCRLSFDITSNSKSFHIDHFEPKDAFIGRIDDLAVDKKLLELVRTKLEQTLDAHVVDALIFEEVFKEKKRTVRGFNLMGLKQIYFNCPLNLWPVSGPSNTSKNALDSLTSVVPSVLESVKRHLPSEVTKDFVAEGAKGLAVSIDEAFQERCKEQDINLKCSIIPMFFDPESQKPVTLLRFFEHTPLGEIADRYADAMNHLGTRALHVARYAARASFREGVEGQRDSKKLRTLLKLANREARAQERRWDAEQGGGSPRESSSEIQTDEWDALEDFVKTERCKAEEGKDTALEDASSIAVGGSSEAEHITKKQKKQHLSDPFAATDLAFSSQVPLERIHMSTQLGLFGHGDISGSFGSKVQEESETKNIFEHEHSDTEAMADDERSGDEDAHADSGTEDEVSHQGP